MWLAAGAGETSARYTPGTNARTYEEERMRITQQTSIYVMLGLVGLALLLGLLLLPDDRSTQAAEEPEPATIVRALEAAHF
jgi:hypothetical protein